MPFGVEAQLRNAVTVLQPARVYFAIVVEMRQAFAEAGQGDVRRIEVAHFFLERRAEAPDMFGETGERPGTAVGLILPPAQSRDFAPAFYVRVARNVNVPAARAVVVE